MCFTSDGLSGMISVMNLTNEDRIDLESLFRREDYDGSVSARAQIVLWRTDGHSVPKVALMAGTTKPTVYKRIARYEQYGVEGLSNRASTGRPTEISDEVRARILALTRRRWGSAGWGQGVASRRPPPGATMRRPGGRAIRGHCRSRRGLPPSRRMVGLRQVDRMPHSSQRPRSSVVVRQRIKSHDLQRMEEKTPTLTTVPNSLASHRAR
jgi:hypothetical protein